MSVGIAITICLVALAMLLWFLRRENASLGVPLAYLLGLLLIHLPGAWASLVTQGIYGGYVVQYGFILTTVGVVCFVIGVMLAGPAINVWKRFRGRAETQPPPIPLTPAEHRRYWLFCLGAGWLMVYGLTPLARVPSIGAAVEQGGAIWMIGVMLGLAYSLHRRQFAQAALWGSALMVYPSLMLVLGGFLSYGSTTVIIVGSFLAVTARHYWRVACIILISGFVGISLFVNYFAVRGELRDAVWGGQSMGARLGVVGEMLTNFKWFDPQNPAHLTALDKRLNQNTFVGLAADRLDRGYVDYLKGRSLTDGLLALVPRILWPEKPVFGGSGDLVRDATGLELNYKTSWGVGNVMEFYINFGRAGLVIGFMLLGLILGILDRRAANALRMGQFGEVFIFFLPAVALIQPNGSLVELSGGSAAALVAAFFWRWVWEYWSRRQVRRRAFEMPSRMRP